MGAVAPDGSVSPGSVIAAAGIGSGAVLLERGRHAVELTDGPAAPAEALALRARCFSAAGPDRDAFDSRCTHVLVRERAGGAPVCCFRLLFVASGREVPGSYSAQFYDLSRLTRFPGPMIEMGRFCVRPGRRDPDILRLAWAAVTRLVDRTGTALLFGCTSFAGTDAGRYRAAFALLAAEHLAPPRWRPGRAAPETLTFPIWPAAGAGDGSEAEAGAEPDERTGMARTGQGWGGREWAGQGRAEAARRRGLGEMPALLRSYLAMGGWVSDHAVIDRQMNTIHVFTGVEIARIPPARQRLLRALAAG